MIKKLAYETPEERENIINEQTALGLRLIEEQNIADGNFLIFTDEPIPESTPQPPTENEILWQTITDLQLDLISTNQALTDAQLEIEMLKGGAA